MAAEGTAQQCACAKLSCALKGPAEPGAPKHLESWGGGLLHDRPLSIGFHETLLAWPSSIACPKTRLETQAGPASQGEGRHCTAVPRKGWQRRRGCWGPSQGGATPLGVPLSHLSGLLGVNPPALPTPKGLMGPAELDPSLKEDWGRRGGGSEALLPLARLPCTLPSLGTSRERGTPKAGNGHLPRCGATHTNETRRTRLRLEKLHVF